MVWGSVRLVNGGGGGLILGWGCGRSIRFGGSGSSGLRGEWEEVAEGLYEDFLGTRVEGLEGLERGA
jgi:hypothetical protein